MPVSTNKLTEKNRVHFENVMESMVLPASDRQAGRQAGRQAKKIIRIDRLCIPQKKNFLMVGK